MNGDNWLLVEQIEVEKQPLDVQDFKKIPIGIEDSTKQTSN